MLTTSSARFTARRSPAYPVLAFLLVSVAMAISGCRPAAITATGAGSEPSAATPSAVPPAGQPGLGAAKPNPSVAPAEVWSTSPVTLRVGHATGQPVLTGIRTNRSDRYEQVVLDFSNGFGDVSVGYAPVIREDPSDRVVQLPGNAFMYVVVHDAVATWNGPYKPYPGPFTVSPNYPTVKQVSITGDFEAVLSFGIGLDRVAGFRVVRLTGPDRLVIDVAERPE